MLRDRQIVHLEVPEDEVELAADALWKGGPSAVSEVALGGGRVRLTADLADVAAIDRRWTLKVVELDSDAYLDEWRQWATPQRAGRRIVLQPAWVPAAEAAPGDLVVVLDPGRAFGSGSHPSTRLVLAVLEDLVAGGERVLDVGCGSGVLAISACRLGASAAVALDIDPAAVEATTANASANGVGSQVAASTGELGDLEGTFDIVLANIGLRVLTDLASALVERVRPGGLLVLAGLLAEQADEVVRACAGCGEVDRRDEAGWSAVVLRRTA
jgi:ribosomal protein L11 methyltransferase